MMLIEEASVPDEVLPVEAFKAHLRLGSGFAEESIQDPVLLSFLRAALAAIEARTGRALLRRVFVWSVTRLRDTSGEVLPVTPVQAIETVRRVEATGETTLLDPASYSLEQDMQRPRAIAMGTGFPIPARGGKIEFRFTAGYSLDWDGIPNDLAQAVFLLAAHYYEYRDETSLARGCMPFGVQSLIERYRSMRLFAGNGS